MPRQPQRILFFCLVLIAAISGAKNAFAASPLDGKVIINEWGQGGDWVELLVVKTADLRGMWVCDSGGPNPTNGLEFSLTNNFWASVPAGTLITVYDAAGAPAEDFDNSDYKLVMNAGTIADPTLFDSINKNYKAFGGSPGTDNPRIFDKNLNLIQDWDQGDNAAFTGALRAANNTTEADAYTSSSATGVASAALWAKVTGGTPGQPNGGANTTWIQGLRLQLEGKVMINEWGQGGDWVEVLVTHDADLRGMWVCDSGGPNATNGMQLSTTNTLLSNIPAGTLITFYDAAGAPAEDVDPADYKMALNCGTITHPELFDPINKNYKAFGGSPGTDNPRLFDKNLVLLHDWDQGDNAAFTGALRGANNTTEADVYTSGTADASALANAANWTKVSTGSTPGFPNGGVNTTWIQSLRVVAAPDPILVLSASALVFPTIDDASTTSGIFTITNNGAAQNLSVTAAGFTGTGASKFSVSTALPLNIPAGTNKTLAVLFNPAGAAGTYNAQINFTSNDAVHALTTASLTAVATASGPSPLSNKVILNEYTQDAVGDWIEILVTQTADLRGLWICDSGGPDSSNGLQFSTTNPVWSAVPAGTLIAVYDKSVAIADDLDSSDFTMALNADPLQAGHETLFDSINQNFKAFGSGDPNDNPRLFDKNLILLHDWDQNNSAAFVGALRASASGETDQYNGNAAAGVSNAANWVKITTGATPGQPNGGANTTWIQSLRAPAPGPNAAQGWTMYE